MKPLILVAAAAAFAAASVAYAAGGTPDADAQARAEANEAAGLPDLRKINRPGAEVTSKVDFDDIRRTPSFHEKSKNGTEVTEYRDRGKPVEIDVKSNFGTRYQMSSTPDTSPKPHDAGIPITRLPSLNLRY
ncbi:MULTISPECIES: hypothetical protein [Burkholderia]|uniref:Transmembrane protein n=1 Tax=Burkholderia lata (strain ATCC 17760 / DSM 23089 / LMG 22485 / NCIMB 9086 / R18194 / 383) TaxID=482957 RepID=A0A6P3CCP1_BURL3|nr:MULTISPECIES: hypothetical protein [Burkholderia]MBN3768482.1 hypothetical protein [Burkholderia sp. Se-20378]MBN3797861.1 hypothetical protein [Burkholderia sp. Ac-20392]VWB11455.1 hypothetical protein BLA6863_00362 [Burkholderia lata]VWB29375.1 hypothetical protein BLA6860_01238 [Burkholderia lata]VWM09577.1 hypothetical protein BLA6992_03578 [Burkholderia lata]